MWNSNFIYGNLKLMKSSKFNYFLNNIQIVLAIVGLIWMVEVINIANDHSFYIYGILPRNIDGLKGIIFHPFIHGSLQHIILNTVPLFILGVFVAGDGRKSFLRVTVTIILLGGSLLWLFGRESYHIGSSVLVFGYFGFILTNIFYKRTFISILISLVTLILYGGLIFGIFPINSFISWEGHLFGMIAGAYGAKLSNNKN